MNIVLGDFPKTNTSKHYPCSSLGGLDPGEHDVQHRGIELELADRPF